jgi:hypothetical protein
MGAARSPTRLGAICSGGGSAGNCCSLGALSCSTGQAGAEDERRRLIQAPRLPDHPRVPAKPDRFSRAGSRDRPQPQMGRGSDQGKAPRMVPRGRQTTATAGASASAPFRSPFADQPDAVPGPRARADAATITSRIQAHVGGAAARHLTLIPGRLSGEDRTIFWKALNPPIDEGLPLRQSGACQLSSRSRAASGGFALRGERRAQRVHQRPTGGPGRGAGDARVRGSRTSRRQSVPPGVGARIEEVVPTSRSACWSTR